MAETTGTALSPVQERIGECKRMLVKNQEKIQAALPEHVTVREFVRVFVSTLEENPKIAECDERSLFNSIRKAATWGLTVGGPTAQAYIIPYGTRDSKRKQAQLQIGYKGLIDLARRSGELLNVAYGVVHEGDDFVDDSQDLEPRVRHKKATDPGRSDRPITHVWAGYLMKSRARQYHVMTTQEINAHKEKHSPSWKQNDSPWQKHWESMAIKTCLKQPILKGLVPISSEYRSVVVSDELSDSIIEDAPEDEEPQAAIEDHSEPQDTSPTFDGITDEVFESRIKAATTLGEVTVILDEYLPQCEDDDERRYVKQWCRVREQEIREARSRKAKE